MVLREHTKSVYVLNMDYASHIRTWLGEQEHKQSDLAETIGKTQAAVNRYARGLRFPDAATARKIEGATAGGVPFAVWQNEFMARSGIAA